LIIAGLTSACSPTTEAEATPEIAQDFVPLISVTGEVVPETWTTVGAQVAGMVTEVRVDDGDEVAQDAVLVRLDATDARLAVQQAEAALAQAQAQVAQLQVGPSVEELAVAEAQIEAARAVISQSVAQRDQLWSGDTEAAIAEAEAQLAAARAEQLTARQQHDETMKCHEVPQPDGSTKEVCPLLGTMEERARYALHAANEAVAAAEARLEALRSGSWAQARIANAGIAVAEAQKQVAEAQLELTRAGVPQEQIDVAEAAVDQAQAALDIARVSLARTEIDAPFAGTVGMVHVRQGEFVAPGQPLITLGDLSTLRIETTDLDEIDVARIEVGQEATITFEAFPDRTYVGRVTHIAPMADPGATGVHYTVILEVEDLPPDVRWGMTAFVDMEAE
jgi:multidrug resistance efflux pump